MEATKGAIHKVIHTSSSNSDRQGDVTMERDLEPKPTKVHLQSDEGEGMEPYTPSGKLRGKRAIITGGDSGIGRSVAILFAMEGAKVAIVYLQGEEDDAQHTKAQVEKNGGDIALIPSDLTSSVDCKNAVERAVQAFGGLEIVINNAATRQEQGEITNITEEQWSNTFRTNVDSCFYVTKYALPHLTTGATIINSASVDSYIGVPSRVDYAASKGAVIAFTRALSNQVLHSGIRVNAVAAGPTWTPLMASGESKAALHGQGLGNWTPMNRLGQPSEVATSYVFLASRESCFISGQTLHPNGGIVVNG